MLTELNQDSIEYALVSFERLCTMILALLWPIIVLKRHLEDRVKLNYTYSYNHYRFWWGVTILAFITLPLMLYSDVSMLIEGYNKQTSANNNYFLWSSSSFVIAVCHLYLQFRPISSLRNIRDLKKKGPPYYVPTYLSSCCGWLHRYRNRQYIGLFGQCGHQTRKFCIIGQFCLCSTPSRTSYIWSQEAHIKMAG